MENILAILLGYPTVIWTTIMLFITAYWSLVVVGALGVDIFPGDGEVEIDAPADGGGVISGLSHALSLGSVPITVVLSLIALKAWILSLLAQTFLMPLVFGGLLAALFGSGLFLGSFIVALWLTTYSARPLKPLFRIHTIRGEANLIGGQVHITSSKVTTTFGTAIYQVPDQDGQELLLNVICDIPNELTHDHPAVITNFDPVCGSYTVRPLAHLSSPPVAEQHPSTP